MLILDPCPLPETLGPKLRAWLEMYLLTGLERRFKCINPCRLFPGWLADAGLRAEGSFITPLRFLATVEKGDEQGKLGGGNGIGAALGVKEEKVNRAKEDIIKMELKTILGRMLWKEMWGGFVEGERWWWDDRRIIEECARLGTAWEGGVIEAVKDG